MGVGEHQKDLRVFNGGKPTGPQEQEDILVTLLVFIPVFLCLAASVFPCQTSFSLPFPKWWMLEVPCVPFHPDARFLTLLGCVAPVITIPRRENLTDPGLGQTLLIRPALACCPLLLIPGAGPKQQQWKEGSQSPLSRWRWA